MKLYISNLAFSATKQDVLTAFAYLGIVEKVRVITSHATGNSRGFCFVEFKEAIAAQRALRQGFIDICGRKAQINLAKPKEASNRTRRTL